MMLTGMLIASVGLCVTALGTLLMSGELSAPMLALLRGDGSNVRQAPTSSSQPETQSSVGGQLIAAGLAVQMLGASAATVAMSATAATVVIAMAWTTVGAAGALTRRL